MKDYDKSKESLHLMYFDENNFYQLAMPQNLLVHDFLKWGMGVVFRSFSCNN